MALTAFLICCVMGLDEFPLTGTLLGLSCVVALCLATRKTRTVQDVESVVSRRRDISLIYSAFLLVFFLFYGVSSRGGVVLGLYGDEAVDQYEWPMGRVALFAPAAVIIVAGTLFKMWKALHAPRTHSRPEPEAGRLPLRMVDLMTVIGFVGAVSIWPAKIGIAYALFLCLALFAYNRLNRRFDDIDRTGA
jgi:hypothetical protein